MVSAHQSNSRCPHRSSWLGPLLTMVVIMTAMLTMATKAMMLMTLMTLMKKMLIAQQSNSYCPTQGQLAKVPQQPYGMSWKRKIGFE